LSQRKIATVTNAVIKDLKKAGVVIPEEIVVGKSKVHSCQNILFKNLVDGPIPDTCALSLDGKIYETLQQEEFGDDQKRNIISKEDHFAVCDASREEYIAEFQVDRGTGSNIAQGLEDVRERKHLDKDKITILMSDSTAAMSGRFTGCLAIAQEGLGHSCHEMYCCLHLNELPMRSWDCWGSVLLLTA
jgi:hypothetical protein